MTSYSSVRRRSSQKLTSTRKRQEPRQSVLWDYERNEPLEPLKTFLEQTIKRFVAELYANRRNPS